MRAWIAGWGLVAVLASSAQAFDVTACGQVVPAGQMGVLQADIDCGAASGNCFAPSVVACAGDPSCTDAQCPGVVVGKRATIQMNGHTVSNGVVLCADSCSVVGPGTVVGGFGVNAMKDLVVSGGLDVHDGVSGISAFRNATVSDATVTGVSTNRGIWANRSLRLANVSANGNYIGVEAEGALKGAGVTANNNLYVGVAGRSVKLTGATAIGNGFDDDGLAGVFSQGSARLEDSVVTGNLNVLSGVARPLDVFTGSHPRLVGSTCAHSRVLSRKFGYKNSPPGLNWGVCTDD